MGKSTSGITKYYKMAQPHAVQRTTRSACDPISASLTMSVSSHQAHSDNPNPNHSHSPLHSLKRGKSQVHQTKKMELIIRKSTHQRSGSLKRPPNSNTNYPK